MIATKGRYVSISRTGQNHPLSQRTPWAAVRLRQSRRASNSIHAAVGQDTDLDVAISGGGPAGLAAALAVLRARPSATVKVFESVHSFKPQGAGVLMNVNGFRALKAISPETYQKLLAKCILLTQSRWTSEDGKDVHVSTMFNHDTNLAKYGETLRMVSWHDIRQTIYEALPPGIVEFSQRVTGYTDDGSKSGAVTFQVEPHHASSDADKQNGGARDVRAKVLIGADGYFSRIRKQTLNDGPPEFTGRLTWRARVEMSHADQYLLEHPTMTRLWINRETIGKDRSAIIYPAGDTFVWTANCPVWRLEQAGYKFDAFAPGKSNMGIQQTGLTGASAHERCLKCFEDYPEELTDMMRKTPVELVTEHGYYRRTPESMPQEQWGMGLVTLAGDSAHLAPPDGQGLNLAIEDAAILGWRLQTQGLTQEALRCYERERLPRVKAILSYGELQPERQAIINEGVFQPLGA